MMKFNATVMITLFVLLIVLLIQNAQLFTFRFLIWTIRIPEVAAILLLVGIGFVLGFFSAVSKKKKVK